MKRGCYRKCLSRTGILFFTAVTVFYVIMFDSSQRSLPSPRRIYGNHSYMSMVSLTRNSSVIQVNHDDVPSFRFIRASKGSLYPTTPFTRCDGSQLIQALWETGLMRNMTYIACTRQQNGTIMASNMFERLRFYARAKLPIVTFVFKLPEQKGDFLTTIVKISLERIQNESTTSYNISNIPSNELAKYCPSDVAVYVRPQTPLVPNKYRNLTEAIGAKIDQNCINEDERKPSLDQEEPTSIAVCAKIAFDRLDPNLVIEWVEYNIKMGVSMILVYTHNLNEATRRVLQHYEEEGYMKILTFDFPLKGKFKRKVGGKNGQSWNDEQAALSDCHQRLRLFKYVLIIDFDEFLVPVKDNDYVSLFEKLQTRQKWASAFVFTMNFHITEWTDDNRNSGLQNNTIASTNISESVPTSNGSILVSSINDTTPKLNNGKNTSVIETTTVRASTINPQRSLSLYAERFSEHTNAIWHNMKMVLVTGRSHSFAPWTHTLPRLIKPYKRVYVKPGIATIHHFRKCRRQWKNSTCYTVKRFNDDRIMRLFDEQLKDDIYYKKKLLIG